MTIRYSYDDWLKIGQFIQLDDGKLHYIQKGKGFPVIMLHLFGGNSWWWSKVIDDFAEHFTVYAIDLPGCAQSEQPPLPYGPPEMAEMLKEFMDKKGIVRAHIVGSHGGSLSSAHFATTRPSRVAKLVMDGTPPWNRLEGKKYWLEMIRPNWLDENELPKPYGTWGGAAGSPFPGLDSEEEKEIARERAATDFWCGNGRWWITITKEALKYDVYTRLHHIEAPTLIVNGEHEWGRRSEYRLLNGIVGSELAVISKAGGQPAFEQPEAYLKAVLSFLLR